MITESGNITAILKLQTTDFTEGLEYANSALGKFEKSVLKAGKESIVMENGIQAINNGINTLIPSLNSFNKLTSQTSNFNKFANGVSKISTGLVELSSGSVNAEQGITILNNMMKAWSDTLKGTEVKVKGITLAEKELANTTSQTISRQQQFQQNLANLRNSGDASASALLRMARSLQSEDAELMRVTNATRQYSTALTMPRQSLDQLTSSLIRNSEAMQQNAVTQLRNLGYTGQLSAENKLLSSSESQVSASTNQATQALEKQSIATNKSSSSMSKATTQSTRLKNALNGLRSVGMLVGSMLAYNFVHHLGQATNASIQAKSEMEGYFKMLNYSQSDILKFNNALDETVNRFQRVNKYSLGETISSIGVEFDLTTQEMVKAMDVTSMITSEYLRAGRNANEASLAVKDVLQGQFQRLSRETGVGKDELEEAGWDGDPLNTNSLLDALRKVGESRHWDIFAEKANSMNDIVTILQNRFGEWSADMVNVVQPSIVNAFNSMMSFAGGLSKSLSGLWKWLNSGSWESTATKIGLVAGAILTLMPILTAYRGNTTILRTANMSLTQSLASLIFGIEAETMATNTASGALAGKLLGITSVTEAEGSLVGAINMRVFATEAETVATAEGGVVVTGFTSGLYAMIAGEGLAEGSTVGLTASLGMLTGAFLASPIGWFTLGVVGLASAFYVLTGGLSDSWAKMQEFNKTMQDTGTAQKQANEWLNQVKKDAGENSKAFKDAKESVDDYVSSLQSASYWYKHSQTAYENTDLSMGASSKDILKSYGISDKEVSEWTGNFESLSLGKDKYYKAEQVLNKQIKGENSNYANDLKSYLEDVKSTNGDLESAYSTMSSNYENLAKHSYEANTAEDWWSWLWASLYAGMDQFWIDWDKFWAGVVSDIFNGDWFLGENDSSLIDDILGNIFGESNADKINQYWNNISNDIVQGWDDFWAGVSDGIADWQSDAIDFLQPLNDLGDEVNKFLADPLGYLDIQIPSDWSIWSLIGFDTVSASDGSSSDHPSFMEDLSAIFGFDIESWINNFNSDPLGTLGISLPNIDIMGLIQSLIPTGGNLDISGWLNSIFNIDDIVPYFTTNLSSIVQSASSTASNVGNTFSGLKDTVHSHINNVVDKATTGFENTKTIAISKMTAMKDSVGSVINKMTDAWVKMKDSILDSAKLIYDGVKSKFDSVKSTLSDFFTKLQNPTQWGAGQQSMSRTPKPHVARRLFSNVSVNTNKSGAGINPYASPNQKVKLSDLIDVVGENKTVNLSDFLSMFSEGGFGSWSFHESAKKRIFDVGKEWKSAPASIKGIGSIGDGYKVSRFWDGKPSFSFDEFMAVAEAIFSAIPYKFYYDSEWKGNWVNALLSGATNCSDGSDALIALASVFGFSGSKIHTNLSNGTGHFYAMINGRKMDTTHFQNSGSWTPLSGAGKSPNVSDNKKTYNITVNLSNSNIYGVDDLKGLIREGVQEGLRDEFNDPFSVPI